MFYIFDRVAMKMRAKANLKRSYWRPFAISLLIAVVAGFIQFPGSGLNFNFDLSDLGQTNESFYYQEPVYGGFGAPDHTLFINTFMAIFFVIFVIIMIVSIFKAIFVVSPFYVGSARYYVNFASEQEKFGDIAHGFSAKGKDGYFNVVKTMFLRFLKLFLWELPYLVGLILMILAIAVSATNNSLTGIAMFLAGIGFIFLLAGLVCMVFYVIKYYEYFAVPYLLAEHPDMKPADVFNASKELTRGYKWELFVLDLSFLGWSLLGVLAFGVGVYFVQPYVDATKAEAYITLCKVHAQQQFVPFTSATPSAPTAPVTEPLQEQSTQPQEETLIEENPAQQQSSVTEEENGEE